MKKLLLLLLVVWICSVGCKKERLKPPVTTPPPPPAVPVNTAPKVFAGWSVGMFLPANAAFLSGFATDAENNIDRYKWSQLSGPNQAAIQNPDSLITKVSGLMKGEYSFELTVTDTGKLSGKDTMNVFVFDSSTSASNVLLFTNLQAGCWGGECLLVISGSSIPRNVPIRVLMKAADDSAWSEVPPQLAFIYPDNYLRIQFGGGDLEESKLWDVMVRF